MIVQTYITAMASILFMLSMASAGILFSNPKTFRVKPWIKLLSYLNFMLDGAGGIVLFGHTALGWPLFMAYIGAAFILTSGAGLLAIFLYVHALVIPRDRRPVE